LLSKEKLKEKSLTSNQPFRYLLEIYICKEENEKSREASEFHYPLNKGVQLGIYKQ